MTSSPAMLTALKRVIFAPAGIAMIEHGLVTLVMMGAYAMLIQRFGLDVVGLWVLLTALINYAHVGDIWSKGLLSFMGEERGQDRPDDAAAYASTAIITGAIGYFLLMATTGGGLYLSASYFAEPQHQATIHQHLPSLVVAYWLIASASGFQQAFIGFGLPWLSAIQRVGGSLIFLIGIILSAPEDGLGAILPIQIIQGVAMISFGAVIYFGWLTRRLNFAFWQKQKLHYLIRFGVKLLAVGAVQSSIEPIIKLMVGHYAGLSVVTVLELALRLIQGVRGLILSVGQVIITFLAKTASQDKSHKTDRIKQEYPKITEAMMTGSISAFAVLFAVAPLMAWVFFNTKSDDPATALFPLILLVFGLAWLINAMTAGGYFLLVALRRSQPLFLSELWRSVLIAGIGFALGEVIGFNGVLVAVFLGFTLSSLYLFMQAAQGIGLSSRLIFITVARKAWPVILPLGWAAAMVIFWMATTSGPWLSPEPIPVFAPILFYGIMPITTLILLLKFGRLGEIIRAIQDLKL